MNNKNELFSSWALKDKPFKFLQSLLKKRVTTIWFETYIGSENDTTAIADHCNSQNDPDLVTSERGDAVEYRRGDRLHERKLRIETQREQHDEEEQRPERCDR